MNIGKVLVTGATGFAGGALARRLAAHNAPVRVLVRDSSRAAPLADLGVEIAQGDLRDPASLHEAMRDVDVVYHIAAAYRQQNVKPQTFKEVNGTAVRHLLEAASQAEVSRFVHCSTVGVHGHVERPPACERAPLAPGDAYQRSKLEGERIAARYGAEGRLPVTIFRPAGIYGPGDLRFLKLFRGIKRGRFPMIGDGKVLYHLVYIDDLIDGIIRCGTVEDAVGETFIIAGPEYTTLNELIATVAGEVGERPPWLRIPLAPVYLAAAACEAVCRPLRIEPPLHRRRVDFFAKNRAFDISKARRKLGYAPQVSIREGVARTAAWYAGEGLL
ncbi:MAG TPA: NAD-dependent epimerase/dehydratase family protein [Geminicoccaceae bacterium]|nr:NAD-dependent epimerase/dehydratase family protein [Geminicoccaceae bacterium]